MVRIGTIEFERPFCQAGLAGYSDRAMRLVARRRGCPYAVTEALLDTVMLNGGEGLRKSIDINDEDHPVAGQLIGADAQTMAPAAKILYEAGYDIIDLNFACPVKKIRNKARGGHMLLDTQRAKQILRAVRDVLPSNATVTASLRRGFDDSPESRDRFYEVAQCMWELGYAALRVHGRTVQQKYLGRSRWEFLKEVKQTYPHNTILGAGDVFTAADALQMKRQTGVDVVWIARGAIGNPWIFENAWRLMQGAAPSELTPPTIGQQAEALQEHFELAMQLHGESLAGRRMRKMGIKYSRFHPQHELVKKEFISVSSLRDWQQVLSRWYEQDGVGVWPRPTAVDEVNDAATSCA